MNELNTGFAPVDKTASGFPCREAAGGAAAAASC